VGTGRGPTGSVPRIRPEGVRESPPDWFRKGRRSAGTCPPRAEGGSAPAGRKCTGVQWEVGVSRAGTSQAPEAGGQQLPWEARPSGACVTPGCSPCMPDANTSGVRSGADDVKADAGHLGAVAGSWISAGSGGRCAKTAKA